MQLLQRRAPFVAASRTSAAARTRRAATTTAAALAHPAASAGSGMSEAGARRKGAILGAIVADAATMPLHWVYKPEVMADLLKSKGRESTPEFYDPPSCPFYQMPLGTLSPYGAEVAALLGYMDARGPARGVEGSSWAACLASYFTDTYPGYRNKSVKTLITNLEAGQAYPACGDPTDTQANMLCKLPPVVARFAGSPEQLAPAVEAAVRAQQAGDEAVEYGLAAAKILEKVVLGDTVKEAMDWAASAPEIPERVRGLVSAAAAAADGPEPFLKVATGFGVACSMPGALQGALAAARRAGADFEGGVRANLLAGGDNCSRGCYVGALLGAAAGGAPAGWVAKVAGGEGYEAAAQRVAEAGAAQQ
ncbi:hypothetical protein Rsub_01063 [Raphidocelis subcapitata]|uniref:ADP-ribosylglycohydrolase n=1 Tax=Raphidocelis subcapitata TaxID=307507 RepID=A0A2V0NLP9_9CHLO|nr:hypothetical protein Rsub_01063 [Raphidocelis subcapitata]|eukprot:GBF88351.1 hypothetical protein Rsub_01063 [Raphidocelis subcapitata]